jgi:hypothetical protein
MFYEEAPDVKGSPDLQNSQIHARQICIHAVFYVRPANVHGTCVRVATDFVLVTASR